MSYNYTALVWQALGLPAISDLTTLANALTWYPLPIPCRGKFARRIMPSIKLDSMMAQGSSLTGGGGPGGGGGGAPGGASTPTGGNFAANMALPAGTALDWSTVWDPQFEDSVNQESPDNVVNEEWTLFPNGTVLHQLHLINDYSISGKKFAAFPFDQPLFVATRRSYRMYRSEVQLNIVDSGVSLPQEMDGWRIESLGAAVCPVHDLAINDPSDCGLPGAAPCSDMLVMWLKLRRNPSYFLQNMCARAALAGTCVCVVSDSFPPSGWRPSRSSPSSPPPPTSTTWTATTRA